MQHKTTRTYTILILIILLANAFQSCKNQEGKGDINGHGIDVTRNDDVSIHDYFSNVSLVALENNKQSVISQADKITFNQNRYYVLDIRQSAVFIFDENGKYLFKIQRQGRGPGEYTDIADFQINPWNNNLELLSTRGLIMSYKRDGTFVKITQLPAAARAVHFFALLDEDRMVIYSSSEKKRLYFYSRKSGEILKVTHEIPQFIFYKSPLNNLNSPFFTFNGDLCYYEPFTNNVYSIDDNDLQLRYSWDFGKFNFDYTKIPADKPRDFYLNLLNPQNGKFATNFLYNIENQDRIFTSFTFDGKWKTLIYNKKRQDYKIFSEFKEKVTFPALQFFDGGAFAYINPIYLNVLVKPEMLDESNKKLFKSIKIENNPVIVKYFFKK